MKSFFSFVWEITKITVITLAIVIPIRYFLVQPFFVKGASMEPNFEDGQYLVIDEISYRFNQPQRGDVVVFRYPPDPSQFFIKRVIGLPGETVEIADNQIKIYNEAHPLGFVLDESNYLIPSITTQGNVKEKIGSDQYFVLGDNRQASFDSRRWGLVPAANITGRVWLRAWPMNLFHAYSAPQYSY